MPTTDNYIDGLLRSMAGPKISATPDRPAVKPLLVQMEDSEGKKKQIVDLFYLQIEDREKANFRLEQELKKLQKTSKNS